MEIKEVKQVFYNGDVFNVDINNIKSIDKTDVAKINNSLIVYWDKKSKKWKEASDKIKDKFLNLQDGKVKLLNSNDIIDIKINKDNILTIKDNTYSKIILTKIVKLNKDNIWEEIPDNSEETELYNLINNK